MKGPIVLGERRGLEPEPGAGEGGVLPMDRAGALGPGPWDSTSLSPDIG